MPDIPTAARELLAALVGKRIVAVRRHPEGERREPTLADDGVRGPIELELDDGTRIHATADPERRSVLLEAGPLAPAPALEASRDAFWRWRLRRPVAGIVVWKSLDVPERAPELEFGVEVALAGTRGFVVELVDEDGLVTLAVTDGSRPERHRDLRIAGTGSAALPERPGRARQGRERTTGGWRRRAR